MERRDAKGNTVALTQAVAHTSPVHCLHNTRVGAEAVHRGAANATRKYRSDGAEYRRHPGVVVRRNKRAVDVVALHSKAPRGRVTVDAPITVRQLCRKI